MASSITLFYNMRVFFFGDKIEQIEKVEKEMLRKVYAHFQERLQSCVFENLIGIIFRT